MLLVLLLLLLFLLDILKPEFHGANCPYVHIVAQVSLALVHIGFKLRSTRYIESREGNACS